MSARLELLAHGWETGRVWKAGDGRDVDTHAIVAEGDVIALFLVQVPQAIYREGKLRHHEEEDELAI